MTSPARRVESWIHPCDLINEIFRGLCFCGRQFICMFGFSVVPFDV